MTFSLNSAKEEGLEAVSAEEEVGASTSSMEAVTDTNNKRSAKSQTSSFKTLT